MNLIFVAAAVFVLWWLSKNYKKYQNLPFARIGKSVLGGLLLGASAVLLAKGQVLPAIVSFGAGSTMFGWDIWALFRGRGSARISRFTSSSVYLELDNLTGQMDGLVRRGRFAGRRLGQMSRDDIVTLIQETAEIQDVPAVELLQAYLYRRFSSGGKDAQSHADTGARSGQRPGAITEQEAYDILGLKPGASAEEIKGAYRTLMKKLHPDLGGTAYLAARVNEAKDVLSNRHQ